MKYENLLTDTDRKIVSKLEEFIPDEVYDIHTHPYNAAHFGPDAWSFFKDKGILGCADHRSALQRYMPSKIIHGLYFGMPHRTANRDAMNSWVKKETALNGTALSRALKVAAPQDDPAKLADEPRNKIFCGLKLYHIYASRPDTMNASITEYAPEWMWEILHETKGVMMLQIVRNGAIADADNQRELQRLCRKYPNMRLVLAHVSRSFNYRNGRSGLHTPG